ncbi:MAG: hypothetical protein Q3966_05265 [Neisseria sp.]|nr:hypothetical protein [Neisseria sp.]
MKTEETLRLSAVLEEWDGDAGRVKDEEGRIFRVVRKQLLGAADVRHFASPPRLETGDRLEVFAAFADGHGEPAWLVFRKMPRAGAFASGMLPIFPDRAQGLAGRKFYADPAKRRKSMAFFLTLYALCLGVMWYFSLSSFTAFLLLGLPHIYFLLIRTGWQWTAGEKGLVSGGIMPFFVNWDDVETVRLYRRPRLGQDGLAFFVRPGRTAEGRCRYYLDLAMLGKEDREESLALVRAKTGMAV